MVICIQRQCEIDPMKIGVIGGLGSAGKRHANNLRELGCDVFVYDEPDDQKLGLSKLTSCDGIIIASPTFTHLDYLDWCIYNNKPVLVEKPIGDDLLHAQLSISLAKEKRLPVFVGLNLRFHDCVIEAKKRIHSLGKILWANFTVAQYNDRPDYLRDGVCLNWLSHEIDLALYLLGPARLLTAAGDDQRMVDMVLLHDNGCQTLLHGDYVTEPEHRRFAIVGEKSWLRYDLSYHDFDPDYVDEICTFIEELKGERSDGSVDLATGIEGLASLKICLAAREMLG